MKNGLKKFFVLLLTGCLIFSALPISAFAEEVVDDTQVAFEDEAASTNGISSLIPYLYPVMDGNTITDWEYHFYFGSPNRVTGSTLGSDNEESWYLLDSDQDLTNVDIKGTVNLILMDGKTLTATGDGEYAGIDVSGNDVLNIYAQSDGDDAGKIVAKGGKKSAGIGASKGKNGSNIHIYGGIIEATGKGSENESINGNGGAGIGGAPGEDVAGIKIYGGKITAKVAGTAYAAGIGGGGDADAYDIKIYGGEINATGRFGGGIGAAVSGDAYHMYFYGGNIYAACEGCYSAGIGTSKGDAYDLHFYGGKIDAVGYTSHNDDEVAGIGSSIGDAYNIEIVGGEITAIGIIHEYIPMAIGTGHEGTASNIKVDESLNIWNNADPSNPTYIENDGSDLSGQSSFKVPNIKIVPSAITADPDGVQISLSYSDQISEADRQLLESGKDKIKIEAATEMMKKENRIYMLEQLYGEDEVYKMLVNNTPVYMEMNIGVEVSAINSSASSDENRYIDYQLSPVISFYVDGSTTPDQLVITPEIFAGTQGILNVTLPYCMKNFTPTSVTHYNSETGEIIEVFKPEGTLSFSENEAEGTVTCTISHCSGLRIIENPDEFNPKTGINGDNTLLILAGMMVLAVLAIFVKRGIRQ